MSIRSVIARAQLHYRGASRRRDIQLGRWPEAVRTEVVRVVTVQRYPGCQVLECQEEETGERFRVILPRERDPVEVGTLGFITFPRNGRGCSWEWTKGVRT
jgi:hypothetical protein